MPTDFDFARYRARQTAAPVLPAHGGEDAPLFTVSALNALVSQRLQTAFPAPVRVSGEISGLTLAASGHYYFTLKDTRAELRCTLWARQARALPFEPQHGMQVELLAEIGFYEARGTFQLNVLAMQRAGAGALYEAFLRTRALLEAEGLFDPTRKRPLPRYPHTIGLVTSPAAAALHDVQARLTERAPNIHIRLYPASVQGATAPTELCAALGQAALHAAEGGLDLILIVRGGGSLEDLAAFNDAALARTIRACPVAVVTGIGHETDTTIADLAADLRATTPTMAAELVSAGFFELRQRLPILEHSLTRAFTNQLRQHRQRLDLAASRLLHPHQRLKHTLLHLTSLYQRLDAVLRHTLRSQHTRLKTLRSRLNPPRLQLQQQQLSAYRTQLNASIDANLQQYRRRLALRRVQLELLSPNHILARGYSLAQLQNGVIIRSPAQLPYGKAFILHTAEGAVAAVSHAIHID